MFDEEMGRTVPPRERRALLALRKAADALHTLDEGWKATIDSTITSIAQALDGTVWPEHGPDSLGRVKADLDRYLTDHHQRTRACAKLAAKLRRILGRYRPCPKCRGTQGKPGPDKWDAPKDYSPPAGAILCGGSRVYWHACPRCKGAGVISKVKKKRHPEAKQ